MAPVDRPELAREWAGALEQVIYIARAREEVEGGLRTALDGLVDAIRAEPVDDAAILTVADGSLDLGLASPECVDSSIKVLGAKMSKLAGVKDLEGLPSRLVLVFSASSVGMVITDLDFNIIRGNRALAGILEHKGGKLAVTRLDEIFRPDDIDYLRLRYQVLQEEAAPPFRERRTLLKSDGEEALAYLSASVLRDPDGAPRYYVTTVEDVSERHYLESRLQFQSGTDALTGLPNRQRFEGRLEEALSGKNAAEELTILHIDLDGFHAVNDGLGRDIGDRLLQSFSLRLSHLFTSTIAPYTPFAAAPS